MIIVSQVKRLAPDNDEILCLGQKDNPTGLILENFDSQKGISIAKLRKFLKEMERHDVVTLFDEWIADEWKRVLSWQMKIWVES